MKAAKQKPTKKQLVEMGPLERTIAEIAAGPRCPKCGRSVRRADHDCQGRPA